MVREAERKRWVKRKWMRVEDTRKKDRERKERECPAFTAPEHNKLLMLTAVDLSSSCNRGYFF